MGDSIQATAAVFVAQAKRVVQRGPRDSEASAAHRADWRFLIANAPRSHLVVVAAPSNDWHWLAEDGWNDRVTVVSDVASAADAELGADIVFVQADLDRHRGVGLDGDLDLALATAGPNATVVVEVPRSARGLRSSTVDKLKAAGFHHLRRYLVTPNLGRAKRFTPLADSAGLAWLLGPSPWHRPKPGWSVTVSAAATLLRSKAGPLLADGLLIASRGRPTDEQVRQPLPREYDTAILLTSGHDDGSRAVLLPLQPRRQPAEVLKISPRPAFNRNTDSEVNVVRSLRQQVKAGNPAAARYLPEVIDTLDIGPLRASRETFAGRWSAADLGYRHPETRHKVLRRVLGAATDLALATESSTEPWSAELFDTHVGRLFDHYRAVTPSSRPLDELAERLAARSEDLTGLPIMLARRHYDLGPWNVVFDTDDQLTIIDWEIAPPRQVDGQGLAGADHLYFAKYWLHVWLGAESLADELSAFEFLDQPSPDGSEPSDSPRALVGSALRSNFDSMGIDHRFVPIITAHVWLEKALYTLERRAGADENTDDNGDVGSAGPYLDALAANRDRLLRYW